MGHFQGMRRPFVGFFRPAAPAANAEDIAHIRKTLADLSAKLEKIMATLDDTLAAVQAETTSENAIVALLVGIKKQLDAALGGQLTPSQQMRVDAIFNQLTANKTTLDNAVKANTEAPAGGAILTQVHVTSSLNPANPGDAITLSAAVIGDPGAPAGTPAPTGTVTFMDGSTALGTATVDASGTATLASSAFAGGNLAVGDHAIEARYSGDANYAADTSDAIDQTIAAPAQPAAPAAPATTGSTTAGVAAAPAS